MKNKIIICLIFSTFLLAYYKFIGFNFKGNSLNVALFNKVDTLDPALAFNDDLLLLLGQSYEPLYQYHYLKRPYEVIPLIASKMPKVSQDGTIYTISIKPNVFYHDEQKIFNSPREVIADDFINQIKRLAFLPLASTGKWLFSGKIKGFDDFSKIVQDDFNKMLEIPIDGLKALDRYTLQIELLQPEPNMLYFLSMNFVVPIPKEVLIHFNNDLAKHVYGTGPYVLKSIEIDKVELKRNKSYREDFYPSVGDRYANTEQLLVSSTQRIPFIDDINFFIIEDEEERWNSFINGDLDILTVPIRFLSEVINEKEFSSNFLQKNDINLRHFSKLSSRWLAFNMQDNIVGKNKYLRKAIAHAIDYDAYVKVLSNNTNLKANSIFNPSIPGYSPSRSLPYRYDLDKAKDYLNKAKLDNDFILNYYTRGDQDINLEEAHFFKSELEKIGLKVKIHRLSFSDFLRKGRAGELQFFTDAWIYDYPDAENLIQLLISQNVPGINKSAFKNEKVDQLYDLLSKTSDKFKRTELMYEVEDIINDDLVWIMLMYESSYILHYNYVKNFRKSYFIKNYFKYLKIEKQ